MTTPNQIQVLNDILEEVSSGNVTEFARIKTKQFETGEEVRYDIPKDLSGNSIFVGVAEDGSPTDEAVWSIVRTAFDDHCNPVREQFRTEVTWDDRQTLDW